jgi:tetratricopeptide (TPR) repeat protein
MPLSTGTKVAIAAKGHGQNPEAHRLYLQGRYFSDRLSEEDTAKGIRYLKEALALDPQHASAWAELAKAYSASGRVPLAGAGVRGARRRVGSGEERTDVPQAPCGSAVERPHEEDRARGMSVRPGSSGRYPRAMWNLTRHAPLALLVAAAFITLTPAPGAAQRYVATADTLHPRIKYADSLVSANERCMVAQQKLNRRVRPIYVNGIPMGFC